MSRSGNRAHLRRQRQAKRSWNITPEFIKENPEAARMYVVFGKKSPSEYVDDVKAMMAKLSPREQRARRREMAKEHERKMQLDREKERQRMRDADNQSGLKSQVQGMAAGAKKMFMRKKEG